jgi:hypothetical protein
LACLALALALLALGCDGGDAAEPPPPSAVRAADACLGRCSEVELCVSDQQGQPTCARICANQLRCWSGCCLRVPGTDYNVCRPSNACFER